MTSGSADVARRAVTVVFVANGLAMATWASRLPALRDELGLDPGQLGLLIIALSGGAVASLPTSGFVVRKLTPAVAVTVTSVVVAVGLLTVGTAVSVPVVAVGLLLIGAGSGVWDVAMNVEGADVEQRLGRSIMPRFHAGFSLGTVIGAGIGSVMAAVGAPLQVHLPALAVVVAVAAVVAARFFLPTTAPEPAPEPAPELAPDAGHLPVDPAAAPGVGAPVGALAAWTEPRTLLLGVMVLGMALAEGVANDWLALALVDGYGAAHAWGAAGFGVFLVAMTTMRLAGVVLLDRFGRVPVLRAGAVAVAVGAGLVILGSFAPLPLAVACAVVGALAWGGGAALGFPVGMSAAADDPVSASVRVSVVSTIGYLAFLGGPPLLGLLADSIGVERAIGAVLIATVVSLLAAGSARPLAGTTALAARVP